MVEHIINFLSVPGSFLEFQFSYIEAKRRYEVYCIQGFENFNYISKAILTTMQEMQKTRNVFFRLIFTRIEFGEHLTEPHRY